MPFKFEIDKSTGILRETWTGLIDLAQLKDSCIQEWMHRDYKKRMPMISDFRQAKSAIDAKDAVQFALWFGDKDPPSRLAIVVGREEGFGFAKMFAMLSDAAKQESNATKVFYSYEEAEKWMTRTQAAKAAPEFPLP
jgi:hypothetical protein